MLLNYLKTSSNKKLFFQSRHTTKRVLSTMKASDDDYMPVLKYWFGVEDLSQIKSDKYTGNNLVIKKLAFFFNSKKPDLFDHLTNS
jgi:hypothetical protein